MAAHDVSIEAAEEMAGQVKERTQTLLANSWVERLCRFGYLTKGVLYVVLGLLSIQVAIGIRGVAPDTRDALYTIVTQPLGEWLLLLVAIGLFGYVLWRLVQAIMDTEDKGSDLKGLVQRAGYLASALAYGSLAVAAIEIVTGPGGGSDQISTEDWTARFLALPFGPWLVGGAGLGILAYGLEQLYEALSAKFKEEFDCRAMGGTIASWEFSFGRFGYAARSVVYNLIGIFLIRAAYLVDAEEAEGLREVLEGLVQRSYGPWLLGVVGGGLLSYGLYAILESRYRFINPGDEAE